MNAQIAFQCRCHARNNLKVIALFVFLFNYLVVVLLFVSNSFYSKVISSGRVGYLGNESHQSLEFNVSGKPQVK